MSKITIESTIDRRYLRKRTKDEIIEHVMRAFGEIDKLTAENVRLTKVVDEAIEAANLEIVGTSVGAYDEWQGARISDKWPNLAAELTTRLMREDAWIMQAAEKEANADISAGSGMVDPVLEEKWIDSHGEFRG